MKKNKIGILSIFLGILLILGPSPNLKTYKSVPEKVLNSCVKVETPGGSGSGVIVGYGEVLTAAHVVSSPWQGDYDRVNVVFRITERNVRVVMVAEVVKVDHDKDLALLRLEHTFGNAAKIPDRDRVDVGNLLYAIGASAGMSKNIANDGILASKKTEGNPNLWTFSASVYFGNSGGGIFNPNRDWELVGILVQGRGGRGGFAPNVAIFVPLSCIKEFLKTS